MKKFLSILLLLLFVGRITAEEPDKFKVAPTARVLIDGALYFSEDSDLFKNGLAIPEARAGAKMWYGKWSSWIELGFAYGKVGMRNMWIQYDFNPHSSFRIGNFLQPFGLQSVSSANVKTTFEQPLASVLFTPGLQLGAMYTFYNPSLYTSSSFHVESSALTNVMNYPEFNRQGISVLTRFAWRKKDSGINGTPIFQAGLSLGYSTPQRKIEDGYDVHDGFSNFANFPTKVTTLEAIGATVGNARYLFKLTPELIFSKGKVGAEAQYFMQTIGRKNGLKNYTAQGGYITLRGILIGDNYTYDSANAQIANPTKRSLELVLDYNYATLSDKRAQIWGGRANSFNATLNYYINKYITARLNYSYTHIWDRTGIKPMTQNVVQARLMVLF